MKAGLPDPIYMSIFTRPTGTTTGFSGMRFAPGGAEVVGRPFVFPSAARSPVHLDVHGVTGSTAVGALEQATLCTFPLRGHSEPDTAGRLDGPVCRRALLPCVHPIVCTGKPDNTTPSRRTGFAGSRIRTRRRQTSRLTGAVGPYPASDRTPASWRRRRVSMQRKVVPSSSSTIERPCYPFQAAVEVLVICM